MTLLAPRRIPWSHRSTTGTDCTIEQLAPYIGRIKTEIARYLVKTYTVAGDLVLDPFAGSGVIPFEAALLGRRTISSDVSPYAIALTAAKFSAPKTEAGALRRLQMRWACAVKRQPKQDLRRVPAWVRKFFHPETLRSALALRDELIASDDSFLLACLLGILHHQRPGFLSYPSSHLVPYLRSTLFPRAEFPEMYEERDVLARMVAKVKRTYRRPAPALPRSRVELCDSRRLEIKGGIDAIITSPPYMNELDYVRDNRLRLWFLLRRLPTRHQDIRKRDREGLFAQLMTDTFAPLVSKLRPGGHVVLVVGDSRRGSKRINAASLVQKVFCGQQFGTLELVDMYRDAIPDIRRARRDLQGTKSETVLVYRRTCEARNA